MLYFLFSYKFLSEVLNKNIDNEKVKKMRDVFENVVKQAIKSQWSLWVSIQAFNKIKDSSYLSEKGFIALENLGVQKERATEGTLGFDSDSLQTTSESAKNLSYKKRVIVLLSDEEDINLIHKNSHIVASTTSDFEKKFTAVRKFTADNEDVNLDASMVFEFFDGKSL